MASSCLLAILFIATLFQFIEGAPQFGFLTESIQDAGNAVWDGLGLPSR